MADSPQLAILRGIKDRLTFDYVYDHGWETIYDGAPETGFVFYVREPGQHRKFRITVTDLGIVADE